MIIIGELINAIRKSIAEARELKDATATQRVALDAAIVNPLDKKMMASIMAADAMVGKDNYCMNYLRVYRAGMLEP